VAGEEVDAGGARPGARVGQIEDDLLGPPVSALGPRDAVARGESVQPRPVRPAPGGGERKREHHPALEARIPHDGPVGLEGRAEIAVLVAERDHRLQAAAILDRPVQGAPQAARALDQVVIDEELRRTGLEREHGPAGAAS